MSEEKDYVKYSAEHALDLERQNTTLHDMLDKLEAKHLFTEQRLSQAEAENQVLRDENIAYNKNYLKLMDVAGKMAGALKDCFGKLGHIGCVNNCQMGAIDRGKDGWEQCQWCSEIDDAKLALASWQELEKK